MKSIDLNADLGEGAPHDEAIIPLVSSANIACGGHAGDVDTMRRAIELCLAHGTAVGAHPSFPDREHFGRVHLPLTPEEIRASVAAQLADFARVVRAAGATIHHVKPHGALYHHACADAAAAESIITAMRDTIPATPNLFAPANSALARAAQAAGVTVFAEAFADRRYAADGSLVPRNQPGAVLEDPAAAVAQALEIASSARVSTAGGKTIAMPAQTLCTHGDGPHPVALLTALRAALENAGFAISARIS